MERIIITMTVRNHPGVMSHIAGLFSHRAVNIEEIAVRKTEPGKSRMTLLVTHSDRSMTVLRELSDNYDVLALDWADCGTDTIFAEGKDLLVVG